MNQNFIKVNQNQLDVDIDLRYASKNNFTGNKIYFSESCFLHKIAYEHLCKAVDIAKKIGFKIKIFDAYRPTYVQKKLCYLGRSPRIQDFTGRSNFKGQGQTMGIL